MESAGRSRIRANRPKGDQFLRRLSILIIFLTGISSFLGHAEEEVHLAGFPVPHFIESDSKGEFIQLAKSIAKSNNLKLKISIAPPQRVLLMAKQGLIDGYFPGLAEIKKFADGLKTIDTIAFYYKKDYLFTYKGNKNKNLLGSKICLTAGYPYDHNFVKQHKFQIEFSPNDQGCLRMLALERVDFFLGELISGFSAIEKLEAKEQKRIELLPKPIASLPVFFSFRHSDRASRLVKLFNQSILSMRKNGQLSKLFQSVKAELGEKYQFSFDPLVP